MAGSALRFQSLIAGLMLLATGPILAQSATQEIYKWTDGKGHVHYSSTPPAGRKYQTRTVPRHVAPPAATTAAAPATAGATAARPGEHPQCAAARANLASLADQSRPVMMDSNGDGQPDKTLSPAERQQQVDLAQKFLSANNCGTAAPTTTR